jgi:WD40 repeat protein
VLDHGRSLGKPLRSVQFVEQAFDHASPRAAILHQWNERSYGVDVFDLAEHKLLRQLSVNGWSERRPPEFSAHERGRIFTPGEGRRDLAWSLDTGKQIGPRLPPKPTNSEGVPSPDGRLVARTDVGRVLVSEKATGQPLWSLPHGGGVTPVQRAITSPDGQQLALVPGGKTRKFLLLRPGEGKVSFGLPDPRSDIAGIAFGPVGSTFASFSQQTGKLTFWNPQTLEPWGDESVGRGVQSARWSPDGRLLAVTDLDGALTLWTDRTPRTLPLPGLAVSDLRFTDDSAHLIGIGRDGALMAWSTASAWPTGPWDFGLGARFELTASTEDEISHEIVVHSPSTSEIVFLDFLTGATRRLPDCLPGDHATALGLHGRRRSLLLAAGNSPGALCDLDGKLVARLAAGEGGLRTAAAYDPSGRRVATVGEAGTGSVVRVRHTTTGNILFELPFPENKPSSLDLAFTSTALMVRREQGTSFHPLRDCSALDLRLIERQDALGWLVTDGAGHFDGNRAGRESVWVQGPSTQRVEHLGRVEQEKHRVEGLLFGVRLFSCTNRGRPPEDEP